MNNKKHNISENKAIINILTGIIRYAVLIIVSALSVMPVVWVFLSSFKDNAEILNSAISLPQSWSLRGYAAAFKIAPLHIYYVNSIIISVASIVLNVLLVGMAAYVIARFNFRFKNALVLVFSVSLLLPMTALIHPVYMIIKNLGLYNTKAGLILVYTSLGLPTTLFIMRSYFLSIPQSIEEAAYIDGSGFFNTFVKIVLPTAKPGLATAAILQFLMAWNEFLYALVLTNAKNSRTLPLALNYFASQFSFNYTAMFAAIVVIVIPSIIVYIILQEQVVGSLTAGSVKG